jgi:AraC-like DNA-binding protein
VLRGNGKLDYREQGFDVIEIEPADTGLFVLTRDRGIRFWDGLVLRDLGLNFICYTMKPWTDGRWLLATDMGLGIWQPEAEVVDFLTTEDGLSSNAICSIHVDDEGLIWFSTFAGVQCYKEGEGIIETQHGNIEFNRRSFALGPSDVMYFGSVNGIFPVIRRGQKFSDKNQDIWFITLIVALLALTSWVVWSLRRIRRMNQERQAEALSQTAELFALQIEKLTLEHLPHASVSNLADALGLSERQFFRKAAELGVKPGNIIRSAKVKRAKLLLLEGNLSFSEVAHQVGYSVPHLRKLLSARTSS